jgi:hypothetical protein
MKFALLAPVLACGEVLVTNKDEAMARRNKAHERARLAVTPEDINMCMEHATQFVKGKMTGDKITTAAADHCALSKAIGDTNYVCPHFEEGIRGAFATQVADRKYDAEAFCYLAETHFLELRGAARVPDMGHGPLIDFHVDKSCIPAVKSAFAPDTKLSTEHVPDFWYAMCVNQDCAHFLPSKTRWCDVEKDPDHGIAVCDALRTFVSDEVQVLGPGDVGPSQVCEMYGEFVKEMGINVEAYEHVMHKDSRHKMPKPANHMRALGSQSLQNRAFANQLKMGAGKSVDPIHARSSAQMAGPASILALLAAFWQ